MVALSVIEVCCTIFSIIQWIYIGMNFDHFQNSKIDFLPLWLTKFQSGYHFGYYIVWFLETHLSNSFPLKMLALTRHIFLYILIFVNFPQIPYFAVYHVWARSSSRGVLMTKIFSESKSMKSGLSNAVSNVPVALFNAEISYNLNFKKSLHSELWRAFS